MKKSLFILAIFVLALFASSCQPQPAAFTDAQKAVIADSAKAVVLGFVSGAQKLSGAALLARYSRDPDVRYLEDGVLYPSLDSLELEADNYYRMLQSLAVSVDALDVIVLGPEAAVVTEKYHSIRKTKAGKEVKAQGLASFVVQLRAGRWHIVHSHESHLNAAELDAAVAPPKPKK